jgi:hypothetical protein
LNKNKNKNAKRKEKKKKMQRRLHWDLEIMQSGKHGMPVKVCELPLPEKSSKQSDLFLRCLSCENSEQKENTQKLCFPRVLDMPLHMPGHGWRIPEWIQKHFGNIIDQVSAHEKQYEGYDDRYVYITIDQRSLNSNSYHRRPGFHSDGFASNLSQAIKEQTVVDHTYVICNVLPTEFVTGGFPLEIYYTDEEALAMFEREAIGRPIVTFPSVVENLTKSTTTDIEEKGTSVLTTSHPLLMLTPYVIHRTPFVSYPVQRLFVKVSVSQHQFCREGNTHNDLFDYDWIMYPRDGKKRNHPYVEKQPKGN